MDSRCAVLEVDVMGKIKATHRETRVKRTPLGPLLVSATGCPLLIQVLTNCETIVIYPQT